MKIEDVNKWTAGYRLRLAQLLSVHILQETFCYFIIWIRPIILWTFPVRNDGTCLYWLYLHFPTKQEDRGAEKGQDLADKDNEAKIRLWAGQSCVRIKRERAGENFTQINFTAQKMRMRLQLLQLHSEVSCKSISTLSTNHVNILLLISHLTKDCQQRSCVQSLKNSISLIWLIFKLLMNQTK